MLDFSKHKECIKFVVYLKTGTTITFYKNFSKNEKPIVYRDKIMNQLTKAASKNEMIEIDTDDKRSEVIGIVKINSGKVVINAAEIATIVCELV